MDSTGEIWKIQVPETTAMLLRKYGYTCIPRGEVNVKGKGIMLTYWVLAKDETASPTILPAGIPIARTPTPNSLHRQTSSHSSLAAVVLGMIQVTQQTGPSARKFIKIKAQKIYLLLKKNTKKSLNFKNGKKLKNIQFCY